MLIAVAVVLLSLVFLISSIAEASDQLRRQEPLKWYFGEGLSAGDFFKYQVCDYVLKIPESPDHCYVITLDFLQLLPSPQGKTWIVAVHVDHKIRQLDMIFQILEDSFKIKTDVSTIPYAHSIERTLGWMNQYASKFNPQILSVGKSWDIVTSQTKKIMELSLDQIDSVNVGDDVYETYKLGYSTVKESFIQIEDEFPFPIRAVVYKPVLTNQNTPTFTVDLLSYSRSNLCYFESELQVIPINSKTLLQKTSNEILNDTSKYGKALGNDLIHKFDTISTDVEIEEIENYDNHSGTQDEFEESYGNHTFENLKGILNVDYGKIIQVFGNITRFLQFLTDAANQIIDNETKNK